MSTTGPAWEELRGSIAGELVLAGTPEYERRPKPFNARFHDIRPRAIAACSEPEDVAEVISFARRHGLELAARSGGHCLAGRSSGGGIVIDVTPMDRIAVEGGVARVGAGARLGLVYDSLQEHGLAVPAGTCPSVGVAGLTLGGGLGILGRRHGLTSDRLVEARIVLAEGRVVGCDEHHHEDLFWALRGAGAGNFGIVTSLSFRPVPAPEVTNFHASWPFARAAPVIRAWQDLAPDGPDELAASLKVTSTADPDRPPSVDVYGALLGAAESDAIEWFDGLVVRTGTEPTACRAERMSFPETRSWWANLGADGDAPTPHTSAEEHPVLFARSEFFRRTMPPEAVAELLDAFSAERSAGESRELDFMPWGGAYNRVPAHATAFVHRAERFQLKHAAVVDPGASAGLRRSASAWVTRSWSAIHRWGSGRVFQNFPDPDLESWAEAYYGENVARLAAVKARYDPAGVFRFHQSVPTG